MQEPSRSSLSARALRSLADVTVAVLPAAAVAGVALWAWQPGELAAQVTNSLDADADGLVDSQEPVLGTSFLDPDTDADGYFDAEELARQSFPLDVLSVPAARQISVGMSARGEGESVRMVAALYTMDGRLANKNLRFGAAAGGRLVNFPVNQVLANSTIQRVAASDGTQLLILEWDISPRIVHQFGYVSFFVALGDDDDPNYPYQSAATVDLASDSGVVVIARTDAANVGPGGVFTVQSQNSGHSLNQPILSSGGGGGNGNGIPSDWESGEICSQNSSAVGSSGALVTNEVTSADCVSGYDSYCSSQCSSSVGSTFQTIDPVALIGG